MKHSSAKRLPDKEEKQTELFVKDTRAAQIQGHIFEYKFCALVFLRAKNKGCKFKLASNVNGYGKFDDVFIEYLDDNSRKSHIFVQLKSKLSKQITMKDLLEKQGNSGLCAYCKSYKDIEEKFNSSRKEDKLEGSIDESLFILYTNADVETDLKSNKFTDIGEEKFLMTGGSVLQFNEQEHPDIYKHLQKLPNYREFLRRFRIFYCQGNEEKMDRDIQSELKQIIELPESKLEIAYMHYRDIMMKWWQHEKFFLKDNNSREKNILWKTLGKLEPNLVANIDRRKSKLDELSIKYEESAITYMKQQTEPHKVVLIFASGSSTILTAAKIHQMLSETEYIILNLQQLISFKTEVMLAWKRMFDVLVIESDSSAEVSPGLFNELSGFLNNSVAEKKFIFITSIVGNMQQTQGFKDIFHENHTEAYDTCQFTDIVTDSRKLILNKNVSFQGREVKLSTIVKPDDLLLLNALDCETISLLLENENPSISMRTEDTVKYYIDRTLQCRKQANTHFPAQGRIQPASSGDIFQDVRDSGPHLEEHLGKETVTDWKPSTLLEGDGRIILVTSEPGMGKSTLLTHLAQQTRESHPDMWIVRVNINNCTRELNEFKTNRCDEKGVIKLLTEAAKINKIGGKVLGERLFNYTYNSTGNMVVLIDGVDEVSPHYTEEVIQVLKILSKTKIKRIWVTSRISVKDRLETEYQCQSYSLVPFSEEDQKHFLVKFWKETCPGIEEDYLENLAKRVVKLSTEHLNLQDENFMWTPLQSGLLAEMFKGNLKEYSSTTVELIEHINIVVLYELYVDKKWDIYLSDKKVSHQKHVKKLELYKTFIHNHMNAALVSTLSTQQLEKLTDKTIAEGARVFLQKITEGLEKTGIIIEAIEGRPVFQHRTLGKYLAARWLCDNFQHGQTFMRDHLFEPGFHVVRNMVDRILADKYPLHEAVINSSFIQVQKLLQRKESITEDRGGRTPLHVAVSCRSPELIKIFLDHGADVSSVDTLLGLSPVHYAIRMDDWEMLSLLMEKRPNIREQVLKGTNHDCTKNNACALRAAAQYGHNDLLKYLISKGSSVNVALPGDNSTLLHVAARSQKTETVKILLLLGASTDCQDESGKTPLHVSVETGTFEVIKCLVEHKENVQSETEFQHDVKPERTVNSGNFLNVRDIDGNTPLHLGVAAGNNNIVSCLVSAGSDLNICNVKGDYPLTLAARCGKNDIVELLVEGEEHCEEAQIGAMRAVITANHVDTTALLLRLGVPVNIGEKEKPIHVASHLGRGEFVILLLQYGASLTSLTDTGNTALHLASEAGHLNLVKYLIQVDKGGVCSLNCDKETPLHLAARNGRDNLVTYFAKNGCNINASSANGATSLHVACENGHYTTVECLLENGAQVNAMNSVDQTPVLIAASRGKTKIVELLFQHNANFSLRDKEGITALLAASINGHQDTVRFIVQHGGNIEDTDGKGNSIAHFAVANENYDILNFLSQQNVSLDVQDSDGNTPLLLSVREGRNRMVKYLVDRNSDINTQGNDGMLPLDVAVQKGNMEIYRILQERNASSGKASTHIVAAARFGFVEMLQRSVSMGANINVKSDNGESMLHVACESGQVATVQYLCEYGTLLDLQDNNGNTALHVAVFNGNLDVTRVLVEKGANLCAADTAGSTALHIAAKGGNLNIVQYLADNFAPIDMRNVKKETALLVAAAEGHEEILRILIEQGAGIGVRNIEGKTAFDISTEKGYGVITEILRDRANCRTLICSNSSTDIYSATESCDFEHLQRSWNAGVSIDTATEKIQTDAAPEYTHHIHPNRRTALHIAAVKGSLEEVQRMVEGGIALDYGDPFGRTALWGAAKRGHKNIIRFLLQNGSCRNIPDCEGVTPIAIAAKEGHWRAVDEFLEHDPTIMPRDVECLNTQLHKASESGDLEALHIILKSCINVDTTSEIGSTALHVAAEVGHKEICRILLESGASVNAEDKNGKTPLMLAAEKGAVEIVRELLTATVVKNLSSTLFSTATVEHKDEERELLNHDTIMNIANENLATILTSAAAKGHVEVVIELLNRGAEVHITDAYGSTPLGAAASKGHLEMVRELLKRGAGVDIAGKDGRTSLKIAASGGHKETVRELLNRGARVNIADAYGSTPLSAAASKGHLELVRELLNHGAGVDIADEHGRTPLIIASSEGNEGIVRELLNHGAEVETRDAYGSTALSTATLKGHLEMVQVLLKNGACVDIAGKDSQTPLIIAASEGQQEIVRELLSFRAKVDNTDAYGSTPLSVATSKGHLEMVRVFLDHGAGVDIADKDGRTPLIIAASKGHEEIFRELLNRGAKVDITDSYRSTPLSAATSNGHLEIVRELLYRSASVDIADNDGRTPLIIAASEGQEEIVREILNHVDRVDITDAYGSTPLSAAASKGYLGTVRLLLNFRASVDIADKGGRTPLRVAAAKGHKEVLLELLKRGARVDITDEFGSTPLGAAAANDHLEFVRELLEHGAWVDIAGKDGRTPLIIAASKGHEKIVRELLNRGANVDIRDAYGSTPLSMAASKGHWETVLELLNHGATINITDAYGSTPLSAAASMGHLETVRELLNHGAGVNITDAYGSTPLSAAASMGHLETVRELLTRGATVEIADKDGRTPLRVAAAKGHKEVLLELLNRGASVDITDAYGRTPLSAAASKGYLETVRELLKHGASVDITDAYGSTPLSAAASMGHLETVRDLLNRGASVNIARKDGQTPLIKAASECHEEIVLELLNRGARLDIKDAYGRTPLSAAASKGHLETVRELLKYGAGVNITDEYGRTPLSAAASMGHLETVRELLTRGASVEIADKNGRTPLIKAASEGHEEIVRELLNCGAGVDIIDAYGSTPLSAAALKGHLEAVRGLLKDGASVDIADEEDRTPLIIAASEGHEEVLLELLNHGARVDITDAYGNTPLRAAASNMARSKDELIKELVLRSHDQTSLMEDPEEERLSDMEEEQPEMYHKDKGSAGIYGQIFKYKFCALVFVRIKNLGYKFKLASNVEDLGIFDVFVEYLDDNYRKNHIFVQLKSATTRRRITMEQLLAERGHLSLRKYYESYTKIKKNFNCSEEGFKMEGRIDESLFIIYTNADVARDLQSNKVTDICEAEFLMAGGSVLRFNEREHKAIYEHLQDLPEHRNFLSRFRIFSRQADEKEMDRYIKSELKQIMKLPESDLDIAYIYFRDFITDWWHNCRCFLQDTNSKENDPLRKTSEKLRTIRNRIRRNPNVKNSVSNRNRPQ